MSAREELQRENEEKIRESEKQISCLMEALGRKAVAESSSLSISVGERLLAACFDRIEERRKAEARLASIKSASAEHEGRKESLGQKNGERDALKREKGDLEERLGAMIYERCAFSLLDKERYRSVYHDIEREEKGRAGHVPSWLHGTLEKRRFRSYCRIALSSPDDAGLDGSASAVLEDIITLLSRMAELDKERRTLSSAINAKRRSYRVMARGGLERAEKALSECVQREAEAMESYGRQLYEKGAIWLSEETPSAMLDDMQAILEEKRLLDTLLSERARLGREARADDLRALLESEEGKLRILARERERIDEEIASIEKEAERLRSNIAKLQSPSERRG